MIVIKILITGVAGFKASHLSKKYVDDGHYVIGLDNLCNGNLVNIRSLIGKPNFRFVHGDIRDKELVDKLMVGVDAVLHLAAIINADQSFVEPRLCFDVNQMGTLTLLESARLYANQNVRFIYASSSEVYGSAEEFPMLETHILNPCHQYGVSKLAGEKLAYSYAKVYGMNVGIARCFNCFGSHQLDSGYGGVISIFVKRVLAGLPPVIFGLGDQTRDYLFVSDAVSAYDCLLNSDVLGPINFGTSRNLSINKIAELVIAECGKEGVLKPVHVDGRPNEVQDLVADISKAKRLLDWSPKVSFEQGLKSYVNWTRNFKGEEWKIT